MYYKKNPYNTITFNIYIKFLEGFSQNCEVPKKNKKQKKTIYYKHFIISPHFEKLHIFMILL